MVTARQCWVALAVLMCLGGSGVGLAQDTVAENAAMTPKESPKPEAKRYDVWVEDCLEKVFQDAKKPETAITEITIHAARGEYEAAQIAVSPKDDSIGGLRATCEPLVKKGTDRTLPSVRVRYVDSVPIGKNTWQTPPEHLIATAPTWIPDVLYEADYVPVWQNRTRAIWLTINVPIDAEPGEYSGQVTVFTNESQTKVPITVQVHAATVPAERNLKMTNWVYVDAMRRWNGCEFFDERFWKFVQVYADNLASHRQNMIMTPLYCFYSNAQLVGMRADGDQLNFDFGNFDRWVGTFLKAGIAYIEGSHLGWIDETLYTWAIENGKAVQKNVRADSPEAERYLARFLPALQAHLEEKGWIDVYYQHLRDEPPDAHVETYNKTMALLHRYAPKIKTIEATHSTKIELPTVVVPLLSNLAESQQFYRDKQREGQEVWFYAACGPNGSYANRFIDYHLLKVRYAHWLNFKYDVPGYLHWGYNFWPQMSPYSDIQMTWAVGPLPPGDSYVVYPTPNGVLDSIRWETVRDGIEDYELLRQLKSKDAAKADEICSSLIRGFDQYDVDTGHFRAARLALLDALK